MPVSRDHHPPLPGGIAGELEPQTVPQGPSPTLEKEATTTMIRTLVSSLALTAALCVPATAQANYVNFSDLGTTGCGPTLAGTYTTLGQGNGIQIDLTVTTEQDNAVVLIFIGDAAIIPGLPVDFVFGQNYGCLLYTDPVFTQSHQASAHTYDWSRSLGGWWGTAYVQFVEVFLDTASLEVKTTNLLEVNRPLM